MLQVRTVNKRMQKFQFPGVKSMLSVPLMYGPSKKEDLSTINMELRTGLTSINILAKGLFFTRKTGIIVFILKRIIVLRCGE